MKRMALTLTVGALAILASGCATERDCKLPSKPVYRLVGGGK